MSGGTVRERWGCVQALPAGRNECHCDAEAVNAADDDADDECDDERMMTMTDDARERKTAGPEGRSVWIVVAGPAEFLL